MSDIIRPYQPHDRPAVRVIYGMDEFARPHLMHKYPRMCEYLADSMSHYSDFEPQSCFVAEVEGQTVGALLGTVNTVKCEKIFRKHIRPLLIKRCLTGVYGWPGWLMPILRTELASWRTVYPKVNLEQYPAHLHIGLLPKWRRKGLGTVLMAHFATYLRQQQVAGYHLYASSFHPLGVAFYQKLGLAELGGFQWRFHDGIEWFTVNEHIFGMQIT